MNQPIFDKDWLYMAICATAPDVEWLRNLHIYDCVDSTNNRAKEMAEQGCPHGTVIIADRQTMGRGRMGRSFHSPSGLGLYMTVVLRPECQASELMHLTCAVAVAVIDGIRRELHMDREPGPMIKWTNDIVFPPYKVGGILTELSLDSSGKVRYAIVGIGLNLYHNRSDFPAELQDIAGSLGMFFPTTLSRHHLINSILLELRRMDRDLLTRKKEIMERYRRYCCTIEQQVSVHSPGEVRHGTAIDVDENGGLVVRFEDGHVETVSAGEVSIRGMCGYV